MYIVREPLALSGFLQNLSAKYKWRPKKFYCLSAGPRHCASCQIRRWLLHYVQWRWGPKVGPRRAQIWRNSGFVESKIDGENAAVWSEKWCDLQTKRKKAFTKNLTVFPVEIRWSPKKKVFDLHMLIFQCHFDGPPLDLMDPLLGPLKPTAFLKPMGPFMGPGQWRI